MRRRRRPDRLEGEEESPKMEPGSDTVTGYAVTDHSDYLVKKVWKTEPNGWHPCPSTQKITTGVYKELEKLQPLCFVGRKASWCIHYGKQHESSLKCDIRSILKRM